MEKEIDIKDFEALEDSKSLTYIRKDYHEDLDDLIYAHKSEPRWFRVGVTRDRSCWTVCCFESDMPL